MTKVTFFQNQDGVIVGFEAKDHSGYAAEGEDIVCAAVSALVIHTINSIERFTNADAVESSDAENAVIHFSIKDKPGDDAELLLKSLAQTLSDLEENESYKDFIDVKYVEV